MNTTIITNQPAPVAVAPANSGKGYDTPVDKQQVYVPAAVWQGHPDAGGGGPTVSVEEALELGAIPGTIDLSAGTAEWPQRFFAPDPKAAAVAALEKASEAIREARQASGKSAVCTAAQWARFEAASASAIAEIAFLLNVIAPNAPVYSHFTAAPAEFDLMTAR